jgi:hypothetical protein
MWEIHKSRFVPTTPATQSVSPMCKTRQARPAKFFALLEAAPAFAGPADDAEQGLSTYPSAGECHY